MLQSFFLKEELTKTKSQPKHDRAKSINVTKMLVNSIYVPHAQLAQ